MIYGELVDSGNEFFVRTKEEQKSALESSSSGRNDIPKRVMHRLYNAETFTSTMFKDEYSITSRYV